MATQTFILLPTIKMNLKEKPGMATQLSVLLVSFSQGKKIPNRTFDAEVLEEFFKVLKGILSIKN